MKSLEPLPSPNPPRPPFFKGGVPGVRFFKGGAPGVRFAQGRAARSRFAKGRWFPSRYLLPLLLLLLIPQLCQAARISDYRIIRQAVIDTAGRLRIAIRSFNQDGVPHLLVVDPASLESFDLPASDLRLAGPAADAAVGSTSYLKAVEKHTAAPFPLQNDGATRAETAADGVFLTVDLCPSRRRFERELFEASEAVGQGAPVPVAVAVTGLWLEKHPEEVAYLKKEVAAGRLAITWVNHSYDHPYEPKVPLERNFLLSPGTDFLREVLELEQRLLAQGLIPSPFFRFPGLVSDREEMKRLRELSLIPIGSDAWLAKGESPSKGSFILVHGNGNEPKGVKLLLPMLRKQELRLLPLASAFRD